MIEITYQPSDAGRVILSKRGKKIKIRKYILTITDAEDIDMLSVKGSVHIARTAGLI